MLQAQYDRLKRKALLGGDSKEGNQSFNIQERQNDAGARMKQGMAFGAGIGGAGGVDVGAVVGNMEATGVCFPNKGPYPPCYPNIPRRSSARLS